jgi:hypothetical protein
MLTLEEVGLVNRFLRKIQAILEATVPSQYFGVEID